MAYVYSIYRKWRMFIVFIENGVCLYSNYRKWRMFIVNIENGVCL